MTTVLIFAALLFGFMAFLPFLTKEFVNQTFTAELDRMLDAALVERNLLNTPVTVLHQHDQVLWDGGSKYGKRDAILRNGSCYLLVVLVTNNQTHYLEFVSELRARRALFNKPKEYLAAFGENPDRSQLARLMGGADA